MTMSFCHMPSKRFEACSPNSLRPAQHLQIARMRAKETGRPLLRGTNTGITAIIAADGTELARVPQFEVQVLTGTIQPMQGSTLYAMLGNVLVVTGLFAILGLAVWMRYRFRTARGVAESS